MVCPSLGSEVYRYEELVLLGSGGLGGLGDLDGRGGLAGGHLLDGDLLLAGAGQDGVSHELAHEVHRADGVVVRGDAVVDHVGVGVGVEQADDGDVQAVGLADGDLLALGVDHEDGLGQGVELTGATEVALELLELLAENSLLLLGEKGHAAVLDHGLELLHAVDAGAHGHEVGEHAAEPTLVDVGHAAALGLGGDGLLGLLLGADEEDAATLGGGVLEEGVRLVSAQDGLLKVEDVDFKAKDISLRHTKNKKAQTIPLSSSLETVLRGYIKSFRSESKPDSWLFCNVGDEQMTTNALRLSFGRYCESRGVSKTSIHGLRHNFAKLWIRNNGNQFTLQKILGHSTLEMTRHYVKLFSEDVKEDYDRYSPLDTIKRNAKRTHKVHKSDD